MKKLIEMSVRLWSASGGGGDGGVGGFRRWGRTVGVCVWIKVGQREQPILSGEKMSWMPAANECTVNVGKTTRNSQQKSMRLISRTSFRMSERVKR